jgi:hypothetical protein
LQELATVCCQVGQQCVVKSEFWQRCVAGTGNGALSSRTTVRCQVGQRCVVLLSNGVLSFISL